MPQITLYTSEHCPHCRAMEQLLRENGVTHPDKIAIDTDAGMRQFEQDCPGATGVPQMMIDGQWVRDLTVRRMRELAAGDVLRPLLQGRQAQVGGQSSPTLQPTAASGAQPATDAGDDEDRKMGARLAALDQQGIDRAPEQADAARRRSMENAGLQLARTVKDAGRRWGNGTGPAASGTLVDPLPRTASLPQAESQSVARGEPCPTRGVTR